MTLQLQKKLVVDDQGAPQEVIIPYAQFVELEEALGLDLDEEAKEDLRQGQADLDAGNQEAFVSLEQVEQELGCTK